MKNRKGFTLVEILAVIAVLAILLTIIIPKVVTSLDASRRKTFVIDAKTLAKSAQISILESFYGKELKEEYDSQYDKLDIESKLEYRILISDNEIDSFCITNGKYVISINPFSSLDDVKLDLVEKGNSCNIPQRVYTVAYNCNGGSGSTTSSIHTYNTSKALTTNGCYKIIIGASGNVGVFKGWSTSSGATTPEYTNGQSVINLTLTPNSTVTLYAVWENLFTYVGGTYEVLSDGGVNWRVKFKTSGTFTPSTTLAIDFFLVGGGGGGGYKGGGGGGGYTATHLNVAISAIEYFIEIGIGGAGAPGGGGGAGTLSSMGRTGYSTIAFGQKVFGGEGGWGASYSYSSRKGGDGGCGGGGYSNNSAGGIGGSDGSDGVKPSGTAGVGGTGQNTTTREFDTGDLYAGGGGSGSPTSTPNNGGSGGGGTGGASSVATDGTENTGGGGGGSYTSDTAARAGGSGIVIIRNKR